MPSVANATPTPPLQGCILLLTFKLGFSGFLRAHSEPAPAALDPGSAVKGAVAYKPTHQGSPPLAAKGPPHPENTAGFKELPN